jgi:hypothetical protein
LIFWPGYSAHARKPGEKSELCPVIPTKYFNCQDRI